MGSAHAEQGIMKAHKELPTELGRMMRNWRDVNNYTVEAAADVVGIAKSTWSEIENGKRPVSLETARGLSLHLNVSLDDLARAAGQPVRRSTSLRERMNRAEMAAEIIPGLGLLLDLFPDLQADEVDMLLSSAESLVKRRRHTEPE